MIKQITPHMYSNIVTMSTHFKREIMESILKNTISIKVFKYVNFVVTSCCMSYLPFFFLYFG